MRTIADKWPIVVLGATVGLLLGLLIGGGGDAFRPQHRATLSGTLDPNPQVYLDPESLASLPARLVELAVLPSVFESDDFEAQLRRAAGSDAVVRATVDEKTFTLVVVANSAADVRAAMALALDRLEAARRADLEPRLDALAAKVTARAERLQQLIDDIDAELASLPTEPGLRPSVEALIDARSEFQQLYESQLAALTSIDLARQSMEGVTILGDVDELPVEEITPGALTVGLPATLMGAILAALGLILAGTLRGRIDNDADLTSRLDLAHLGTVRVNGAQPEIALVGLGLRRAASGEDILLLSYPRSDVARQFAARLAELEQSEQVPATPVRVIELRSVVELTEGNGVVLVAHAGVSRRDDFAGLTASLKAAGIPVRGAALLDH